MKNLFITINIIALLILTSCKNNEVASETKADENLIEITKEQFNHEEMGLVKMQKVLMRDAITFSGKIVPKINGIVKISAPVAGKIAALRVQNGQYIQANETLFLIGGADLIEMQQNFASSAAKLKQLKVNYEKTKALFNENIKTENEFLVAESNYKVELAIYNALKKRLQNIGLNIANIENGEYVSNYSVRAPIKGQVSVINVVNGENINTDTEILEIVDNSNIEVQLTFFEKDFSKVKIGQIAKFWSVDSPEIASQATINRLGGKFNPNTNTIDCYGNITSKTNLLEVNQMVSGEVFISTDSANAVPYSAVFKLNQNHYVLIVKSEDDNKYVFEKRKIKTGKTSEDFFEVINGLGNEQILINGTKNISLE